MTLCPDTVPRHCHRKPHLVVERPLSHHHSDLGRVCLLDELRGRQAVLLLILSSTADVSPMLAVAPCHTEMMQALQLRICVMPGAQALFSAARGKCREAPVQRPCKAGQTPSRNAQLLGRQLATAEQA